MTSVSTFASTSLTTSATPGENCAAVARWLTTPVAGVTALIALAATGAHKTTAPATSQTLIRGLLALTLRFAILITTTKFDGYQYYSLQSPRSEEHTSEL